MFFFSRVAVRKDSCSIVAISLNLQQRVHPTIWSLGNLPYDCKQTFPVEKPIGTASLCLSHLMLFQDINLPIFWCQLKQL